MLHSQETRKLSSTFNFSTKSDFIYRISPHVLFERGDQPLLAQESRRLHHSVSAQSSVPTSSQSNCDGNIEATSEAVPGSGAHEIVKRDFDFMYQDVQRGRTQ